jgi:hypothetical protein
MGAGRMPMHLGVAVFLQVNINITAEKIKLTVMPVSQSGVIILTITA